MWHTLELVLFRTHVRGKVSTSSQTACTPQCSGRRAKHMCINHAVTKTAATSIMERALQTTTQECIHTVWKGFDTFHRSLLTPCSSAGHHQERGLLEFAARRSAGSYTPKSRSIDLIRNSPPQRRIYLDVETSTFIAPSGRHPTASYTLSNGGCEPSTPPVDPTNLSHCPKRHQIFAAPRQHQAT